MKTLVRILVLAAVVVAAAFAVFNREVVTIDFWPFPYQLQLPLYLLLVASLALGFLIGSAVTWSLQGKWRHRARERARRIEALEREASALTDRLSSASSIGASSAPAAKASPSAAQGPPAAKLRAGGGQV